jgi:hypothetical protein
MKIVTTWDEWCSVYDALEFWREEVVDICTAQHVPVCEIKSTFPGTHAVFFVNDDIVLKLFCPIEGWSSYSKELRLHNEPLRHNDQFPRIRFYGTSHSGYDFIAFDRLNGRPVREIDRAAIQDKTIHELARTICALQTETLVEGQSASDMRCLVHYDLTEDHIYLDDSGDLLGIIDWGDARMAHPSQEFPVLFVDCFDCDDALIGTFRRAYDASFFNYQINDLDLVDAIRVHPFRDAIVNRMELKKNKFSRELLGLMNGIS